MQQAGRLLVVEALALHQPLREAEPLQVEDARQRAQGRAWHRDRLAAADPLEDVLDSLLFELVHRLGRRVSLADAADLRVLGVPPPDAIRAGRRIRDKPVGNREALFEMHRRVSSLRLTSARPTLPERCRTPVSLARRSAATTPPKP